MVVGKEKPACRVIYIVLILGLFPFSGKAQSVEKVHLGEGQGLVKSYELSGNRLQSPVRSVPLVSFVFGEDTLDTGRIPMQREGGAYHFTYGNRLEIEFIPEPGFSPGWKGALLFRNRSNDTLALKNVVPFGTSPNRVYITGKGDHYLSRTHLFRPGYRPVNVIVPDNAWELGYAEVPLEGGGSVSALTRRTGWDEEMAQQRRFETVLEPGATVTYYFYADYFEGQWQEGLRKMFQERMLYDVPEFDHSIFERDDMEWIRHSYVIHLMMGWDRQLYDRTESRYVLEEFLERGQKWYGGDDVVGLWPTWPALGLDQRNQWDLFRDMPGGLAKLNDLAEMSRDHGTRFFISYNPWDQSTRREDHLEGMATLIDRITADGVVLDTRGSSSIELQAAADSVRKGVVMYSEGMAVPKDMQNIVAGRVHNALYYPPMLNLNKFINPRFAIFRVAELTHERIRREYALSFFNGYGTEINMFRAGQPSWIEKDYRFLGQTVRILREHSSNFLQEGYTPLLPTRRDGIYVNRWPAADGKKIVYTIFSLEPRGFKGPLFRLDRAEGTHYVDLWKHREIDPDTLEDGLYAPVDLEGFNKKWLGTNNEGAVGAIARLPKLLAVERNPHSDILEITASAGSEIRVWSGRPGYEKIPVVFEPGTVRMSLTDRFGLFEGKFVVQLFDKDNELIDERVVWVEPGSPRLTSRSRPTEPAATVPDGMVEIPAGSFTMEVTQGDQFITYPTEGYPVEVHFERYYIDRHPVTNTEFKTFLDDSGYRPADTTSFLKHWTNGQIPEGQEHHPVTYVSYEDAKSYARWAGKRLPTEAEWQYAAQTDSENAWPWGNSREVKTTRQRITETLEVISNEGLDTTLANPGNGRLDSVGTYPGGANPHGMTDLVGSVWQMTNDLYKSGSYSYVLLKGGSYYKPESSWWYVQGGPRKLTYRQMWLRVSPGFERNATVGFRCVKDHES